MTVPSEPLFDVIAVHCCFCDHVVRDPSPRQAHLAMELHYGDTHSALIRVLVGEMDADRRTARR